MHCYHARLFGQRVLAKYGLTLLLLLFQDCEELNILQILKSTFITNLSKLRSDLGLTGSQIYGFYTCFYCIQELKRTKPINIRRLSFCCTIEIFFSLHYLFYYLLI